MSREAAMTTRKIVHEEVFDTSVRTLFRLLHTPSAIRRWWQATRVIVVAEAGGVLAIAWGEGEDDPDYATAATIAEFEPPLRMVLTDYRYRSRFGPLPFEADFVTEFTVEAHPDGASLRVRQAGFPAGPEADDFFAASQKGWRDTFAGIRAYLREQGA